MSSDKRKYKFQNAELGVMSEIMLPKKMQYQSALFQSLLTGIKSFSFYNYYCQNKVQIDSLLENYPSLSNINKEKLLLFDHEYSNIFKGYSMYEVDGVFKFDSSESKLPFVEERTQIMRIYYIPDYHRIYEIVNYKTNNMVSIQTVKNFADLFFINSKVTSYGNENIYERMKPTLDEKVERKAIGLDDNVWKAQREKLFDYFVNWVDAVAFFTFGFVINELTNQFTKMKDENDINYLEEEIWVASQWGVLINKTILK